MRIVIPNYCPADSFVDNVTETLRAMGHEVINMGPIANSTFNAPLYRLWKQVKQKILQAPTDQERWMVETCASKKPQLVLSLTQSLSEEALHTVRKNGSKTISWWGDTAANMTGKGLCHAEWDLIFIKDHYAAFKLTSLNLPAFQLYEAMNPMWHKPLAKQGNQSVLLAGTFYDYRHYLTLALIKRGIDVSLYGGRLPRWASPELRKRHTGKYVVREEKSRVFGEALAVLNSTAMREFASVNCRAFEIAGCGGLQIMEYRSSIEECFEPGKEILVYRNLDELAALVEHAGKSPREMEVIRNAGARRALHHHTYRHRLEVILKKFHEM